MTGVTVIGGLFLLLAIVMFLETFFVERTARITRHGTPSRSRSATNGVDRFRHDDHATDERATTPIRADRTVCTRNRFARAGRRSRAARPVGQG